MDRDAFIISIAEDALAAEAIRQAIASAGVNPARVQDCTFGLDRSSTLSNADEIVREAGLTCSSVTVSSSLRALFYSAQAILSGDVEMNIVTGAGKASFIALLLASPDAVGRWNLMPRARLAARSLTGVESALRAAGLSSAEITISKDGRLGASLVKEVLDGLEQKSARWGMVSMDSLALLLERS